MCNYSFGYYTPSYYNNYGYGYNYYGYRNPACPSLLGFTLGYALGNSLSGNNYGYNSYGYAYQPYNFGYQAYNPYFELNYGGYGYCSNPQVGYNPYAFSNTTVMSYTC